MTDRLPDFIRANAAEQGTRTALRHDGAELNYAALDAQTDDAARAFLALGLARNDRVGVFLPKQVETVLAMFGASRAGGVFVPINPALKARQAVYILRDCNVRVLITSADRLPLLGQAIQSCPDLETIVVVPHGAHDSAEITGAGKTGLDWAEFLAEGQGQAGAFPWGLDSDMAAILYTSGSTGPPKGVVLSHRNMVLGAKSVAGYLENTPEDRILATLPLSFDYGLSQLTTAFYAGATAVLLNYFLPRDVLRTVVNEAITGLACVPPLWVQLADMTWPDEMAATLRYVTNSGGKMPRPVIRKLRTELPETKVYLMYGLTEAFRSTYLPPAEIDRRPDSIGKAIPYAEILVVDKEGRPCPPGTPGELVHRGPLVAHGYWNDSAHTAERFKPSPGQPAGITIPEMAVFSGDTVTMDEEGFLYFVGREDEMIKTSGYRVSPSEVEEVIYASECVGEGAAIGVPHPRLGEAVVGVVTAPPGRDVAVEEILAFCRRELPAFMVPAAVEVRESLPRNPNGKIDRRALAESLSDMFQTDAE